jgi:hypothetical protein
LKGRDKETIWLYRVLVYLQFDNSIHLLTGGSRIGFPAEAAPMQARRPLLGTSGSGCGVLQYKTIGRN